MISVSHNGTQRRRFRPELVAETAALIRASGGPYDLILADPPWRFSSNSTEKPGRNTLRHYPCMWPREVEALGDAVKSIAAPDALLFLWTTSPLTEITFGIMRSWGFRYSTHAIWDKERIGTGFWFRGEHELVYLCRRGRYPRPGKSAPFKWSVIRGGRREHSRKPDFLHEEIDRVFPDARKIELFARQTRRGWAAFGNQTDKFREVG
ncbi:MAG: MT-A70 family methyltransferase [Pseudomonadota bacterium]